jgi:predicted nucleic acid-binding protein
MRYLVDTNVLLRRTDADSSDHVVCTTAVENLLGSGDDLCVCAQVLIEFRSVSTRPLEANGLGLPPSVASLQISDFRKSFTCLTEMPDMADRWEVLADKYSVVGKPCHDARLVALMLAHGVTHLLTLNPSDFTRYAEITAVTPQETS